jgi:hypothetical protein
MDRSYIEHLDLPSEFKSYLWICNPMIEDIKLGYEDEGTQKGQYVAKVREGLGVCIHMVPNVEGYSAQFFPIVGSDTIENFPQHFSDYVLHVVQLAKSENVKIILDEFSYFHSIKDLLTLKCLIEEAADNWSKKHVSHA